MRPRGIWRPSNAARSTGRTTSVPLPPASPSPARPTGGALGIEAAHPVENESFSASAGRSFDTLADQIAARICRSLGVSGPETIP
jgi:hypothetical protein